MQTRSGATSFPELFLFFGRSMNPFLLPSAPSECYLLLYLVSDTVKQKPSEVRYYAQFTEQELDDKNHDRS